MQLVTWYKNVGKELGGNILAPLMQLTIILIRVEIICGISSYSKTKLFLFLNMGFRSVMAFFYLDLGGLLALLLT